MSLNRAPEVAKGNHGCICEQEFVNAGALGMGSPHSAQTGWQHTDARSSTCLPFLHQTCCSARYTVYAGHSLMTVKLEGDADHSQIWIFGFGSLIYKAGKTSISICATSTSWRHMMDVL